MPRAAFRWGALPNARRSPAFKVVNDDRADWREAWALFPGSVAYIWHAGTKAGIVQDSLAACGGPFVVPLGRATFTTSPASLSNANASFFTLSKRKGLDRSSH